MNSIKPVRATAHSNIALVKYWGKRPSDSGLNLPAVGSLSMTLDELRTVTELRPAENGSDTLTLDDTPIDGKVAQRAFAHLDRMWEHGPGRGSVRPACAIRSTNHLPTAAGLASSASGFAALTMAAGAAFGLPDDRLTMANLARQGSGSAARSIWGGFVAIDRGAAEDGSDCRAYPVFDRGHWDLRLVIAHTARGPKPEGSTDGMRRCAETSPYYAPWVESSEADLTAARQALAARDLTALGATMEHSCFKMHACMLATRPPLVYWNGVTLSVISRVWQARGEGLEGYVTSDAGPHVKILCRAEEASAMVDLVGSVVGVTKVEAVAPGPDAQVEILT